MRGGGGGGGGAGYHHRANQTEELRTLRGFHSRHSKYTRCARPGTPERRQSSSLEREGPAPRRAARGGRGVGVGGAPFAGPFCFTAFVRKATVQGSKFKGSLTQGSLETPHPISPLEHSEEDLYD